MPITGTTDNDIVLIIEIIVKDQLQRHDNHRYAKNNHRRSDNRRYTKTVGIQMTTDMPESS
jgi:tagatose-1,6-bisphosphate aldolase